MLDNGPLIALLWKHAQFSQRHTFSLSLAGLWINGKWIIWLHQKAHETYCARFVHVCLYQIMVKAMKRQAAERRQRCFSQIRGATTFYLTLPTIPSRFHLSAVYYSSTTPTIRWWVMCLQINSQERRQFSNLHISQITVSNKNRRVCLQFYIEVDVLCPQSALNCKWEKSKWITCLKPSEVINGD